MNKIGLYIHVPFCRQKCRYCDFYSLAETARMTSFVEKILALLPEVAALCGDRAVDTVYFGGGTPSLLPPAQLGRLLSAVRHVLPVEKGAEITVEANPESLTDAALAAAGEGGANRLSIGMQSADDEKLALLGRVHTHAETVRAVERARKAGFGNISLDLMYALPGQSKDDFLRDLDEALALSPEHLSFYALTLSENVPLYGASQPDDEAQLETYLAAVARLEEKGLRQYEISNAARPGFASRHNLRYWRREEFLGLGPGAWSYFDGERFGMARDLDRFLAAPRFYDAVGERETVDRDGEIEEEVVLSLRLAEGLNAARLASLAGKERADVVLRKLQNLIPAGLVAPTEVGYRLTPRGFFVSDAILADLI